MASDKPFSRDTLLLHSIPCASEHEGECMLEVLEWWSVVHTGGAGSAGVWCILVVVECILEVLECGAYWWCWSVVHTSSGGVEYILVVLECGACWWCWSGGVYILEVLECGAYYNGDVLELRLI